MRNKNNKHLGIEVDPELHYKFRYIAESEGRSANKEIEQYLKKPPGFCAGRLLTERAEIKNARE